MKAVAPAGGSALPDTLPKGLLYNTRVFAKRPAIRLKDLGIWKTWTWEEELDEVRNFAVGLRALGIRRGDTVAIVGDNRPRLYWTMMAAQSLGAIPVPMYQDAVAQELAYVLAHSGARLAVAQNQEQVDKLLSVADEAPLLRHIIYDEPRGLCDYGPGRPGASKALPARAATHSNAIPNSRKPGSLTCLWGRAAIRQ